MASQKVSDRKVTRNTRYLDAFDDNVEEQHVDIMDDEISDCEDNIVETEHSDVESVISDDERSEANQLSPIVKCFTLGRNRDNETVEELSAHDINLKRLNERYAEDLEKCHDVLKEKLNWFTDIPRQNSSEDESTVKENLLPNSEYPILSTENQESYQPIKHSRTRGLLCENGNVADKIDIKVVCGIQSKIHIRSADLCNNFRRDGTCRFGEACEYSHTPKRAICNKGVQCTNKKCTFFHTDKELVAIAKSRDQAVNANPDLCNNFRRDGKCRFGDYCKFSHTPRRPFCGKGAKCTNTKCTFFHPENELAAMSVIVPSPIEQRSQKIWFCKNLIKEGRCRFGDNCIFAHTKDEIKQHVTPCRFGLSCRSVTKTNLKEVFENTSDRKCVRLHPMESIESFINRMQ